MCEPQIVVFYLKTETNSKNQLIYDLNEFKLYNVGLEAVTTALCDEYPRVLGRHREAFVAVLLLFIYICALPTTTYVSIYFSISKVLCSLSFMILIGHMWFPYHNRFSNLNLPCPSFRLKSMMFLRYGWRQKPGIH